MKEANLIHFAVTHNECSSVKRRSEESIEKAESSKHINGSGEGHAYISDEETSQTDTTFQPATNSVKQRLTITT